MDLMSIFKQCLSCSRECLVRSFLKTLPSCLQGGPMQKKMLGTALKTKILKMRDRNASINISPIKAFILPKML
jgi:hypothetical protein